MAIDLKSHESWFDRNFVELSDDAFSKRDPMWKRICKEMTVQDFTVKMNATTGLGLANETNLYAGPQEETPQEMYTNTATQRYWTKAIQITDAAARHATSPEYLLDKYRESGEFSALAKSFDDRKDRDLAYYISNAETSAIAATPDLAALASASHPVNPSLATTYNSNYASTGKGLSYDNVEAALQTIGEWSDFNNQPAEILMNYPVYLMVPTQKLGLAQTIVNSIGQGTANLSNNQLATIGLQKTVWPWARLGDRFTGNNDTDWYLVIPGLSFNLVKTTDVLYRSWIDNKTGAFNFMAFQYFTLNIGDWRGLYKSKA